MLAEKQKVVNALKGFPFIRDVHGCLYDRGSADSYYGRAPNPHYGGVGGDSGPRIEVSDTAAVEEYMAGYRDNETAGMKKDYS